MFCKIYISTYYCPWFYACQLSLYYTQPPQSGVLVRFPCIGWRLNLERVTGIFRQRLHSLRSLPVGNQRSFARLSLVVKPTSRVRFPLRGWAAEFGASNGNRTRI